jgi:hypothetical protein
MRHTFASLLLQDGVPITYVSRQLGHKDSSITLRVYAHWLPDPLQEKLVNRLDDHPHPSATQTQPEAMNANEKIAVSTLFGVVTLTFASWNQITGLLRQLEGLRSAA